VPVDALIWTELVLPGRLPGNVSEAQPQGVQVGKQDDNAVAGDTHGLVERAVGIIKVLEHISEHDRGEGPIVEWERFFRRADDLCRREKVETDVVGPGREMGTKAHFPATDVEHRFRVRAREARDDPPTRP